MNRKEIKKGRHSQESLLGISLLYVVRKIRKIFYFIKDRKAGDPRYQHSGMTASCGFTLIELLVVVLIIGILAAVALPQYQKAVKKTRLVRLIPIAASLAQAEEDYFLANGNYTDDFNALTITLPAQDGCSYTTSQWGSYYSCRDYSISILNHATNIGLNLIPSGLAYSVFFDDLDDEPSGVPFKKGDAVCWSNGETNRQICRSLGPGEEKVHGQGWDYIYFLQ